MLLEFYQFQASQGLVDYLGSILSVTDLLLDPLAVDKYVAMIGTFTCLLAFSACNVSAII